MSPLLLSGLLVGALAAMTPLLVRVSGVGWLRVAAVPLSTLLFATSFTLAGNGPLLRPLVAGFSAAQSALVSPRVEVHPVPLGASLRTPPPFGFDGGFNPAMGPEGPGAGIGLRGLGPRRLPVAGIGTVDRSVVFLGPRNRVGGRVHRVRGGF